MRKNPVLHPFLFSILPVVSLINTNIQMITVGYAVRPALIILMLALFLLFALWFVLKNWYLAGLIESILVILFFSYGHIYQTLNLNEISIHPMTSHIVLFLSSLLMGVILVWIIIRIQSVASSITAVFNIVAIAAVAIPLSNIIAFEIRDHRPWPSGDDFLVSSSELDIELNSSEQPDIYYIILDGYGRTDVLEEMYAFNNTSFLQYLADRGFFIAHMSMSNYSQTHLSLASTLNMSYLDFLGDSLGDQSTDHYPITRLVRHSVVRRILESNSYQVIAFATGYRRTELSDANYYYAPPMRNITHFESMLLENSAAVFLQELLSEIGLWEWYPGYKAHREMVLFTLNRLASLPSSRGPKFVFAHIYIPHPPFVFDTLGEEVPQSHPFRTTDGNQFLGTREEYITGYRDQISYTNKQLEKVINSILNNSERSPIIILQADHGPGSMLDWDDLENTNFNERMSILNAYYLPNAAEAPFYPSITPVNSFRMIFKHVFNTEYKMLPDQSFYSSWHYPYQFVQVTENGEILTNEE